MAYADETHGLGAEAVAESIANAEANREPQYVMTPHGVAMVMGRIDGSHIKVRYPNGSSWGWNVGEVSESDREMWDAGCEFLAHLRGAEL